jgi:hypothetical protein
MSANRIPYGWQADDAVEPTLSKLPMHGCVLRLMCIETVSVTHSL